MSEPSGKPGQPLWAPWRVEYVEGPRADAGCIFCPRSPPAPDRERLILHRGRHALVLLNRYPYAAGHLMVAPHAHRARLSELDPEARAELIETVSESARILEAVYACQGLNVGANIGSAAGAGFAEHLHFHLVPRWVGDVNFMTTVGEIRVIPTHLERSYERLLPEFLNWAPR